MARTPKRGRSRATQQPTTERQRKWIAKHPGANNPRSKNYDPNWRARARGHAPVGGVKEHVSRRARELEIGITTYQRGKITEFVNRQAARNPAVDTDLMKAKLIRFVRLNGYDAFKARLATLRGLRRKRQRETRRVLVGGRLDFSAFNTSAAEHREIMDDIAADFEVPWDWLYY